MNYNKENTLVIAITKGGYKAEDCFLGWLIKSKKMKIEDNYISISTKDGNEFHIHINDTKYLSSNSFVFYNQNKNEEFNDFLPTIKDISKNLIIWRHETDNSTPSCDVLKTNLRDKLIFCEGFNHDGKTAIEKFIRCIAGNTNNYEAYFNELITESLKKKANPHLIALSILCQGYLASHGGAGLDGWDKVPDELKNKVQTEDNKNKTKGKSWWTSALGNDESKIQNELNAVPDDPKINKHDIIKLITAIYTNGDTLPNGKDGNLVAKAYSALKSILKG